MKTISLKLLVIICIACGGVFAQTNEELTNQSLDALKAGKHEQARQLCEKVLETNPNSVAATYVCGIANVYTQNYQKAEKYLVRVETVVKDNAPIYAFLGYAYYLNRTEAKSLADFNISLDYFAKAAKIDPKFPYSYEYRAGIYKTFHGEAKLKASPQLKEAYFSDVRQLISIYPDSDYYVNLYADKSRDLDEYGQAFSAYANFLETQNVSLKAAEEMCRNTNYLVSSAQEYSPNQKFWSDAISFAKACKNAFAKLETDETRKNSQFSKFRALVISYHRKKANNVESVYLANPQYLADLTEAIDAGETQYYDNRIAVYTFQKQFAKADADKKSKVIAGETKGINDLIAEEKRQRQAESDFAKKNGNANGDLSVGDFKAHIEMKKSRLKVLDSILGLNLTPKDKEAFSTRRNQLAELIQKADGEISNAKSRTEANEREQNRDTGNISNFNKQANEALALYQKASQRSRSIDDCRFLVDSYIKKCEVEKLQLNATDIKNALYYLGQARSSANSMSNDETKRKFIAQAEKMIKTVEESLRINEDNLRKVQGK
jgi:hypothetical protein